MKKLTAIRALAAVAAVVALGGLLLALWPGRSGVAPRPAAEQATPAVGASADTDARRDVSDDSREEDFRQLAEAAMKIRDPAQRQAVLAGILTDWLAIDPAGVGKYIMLLEVANDRTKLDSLASALSIALGRLDPKLASSEAVREPIRRMILHLARFDPDAALEWAATWLEGDSREAVSVNIARTLAQRNPQEGLDLAAHFTSPLRRMQAFAVIGGVWARSDPAGALAWASQLTGATERAMALNSVLTSLAQDDPHAAAARLASAERGMTDEYEKRYRDDLAAMNLTEADLANDRERYLEMLEAGEVPPPTSSDVELLGDAARVVARKLALERPEAGIAWAEALENEFLWLDAIAGAVAGWSQTDPAAAADYVATNHPQYPELLTTIYDVWANGDPAQAAAGARLLKEPGLRAVATEAVAQAWAVNDPAQAAAWLDRLPAADRTDAVLLAVVSGLSAVNPIEAWKRAQAIQDPSLQYRGLKAAFSTIVTQQPAVARDLLASATLTDTAAERLHDLLAAAGQG